MKNVICCLLIFFSVQTIFAQLATRGEIYDYQIGDEFHYELTPNETYAYGISRTFILDRVDISPDSVVYTLKIEEYNAVFPPGAPDPIETYTVDTFEGGLGNLLDTFKLTHCDDTLPEGACYSTDSIQYGAYCGRDVYFHQKIEGVPFFEYDRITNKYSKGLGNIYRRYSSDSGGNYTTIKNMIYFKKTDSECGTPNYTSVGITITENDPLIKISPNPSTGLYKLEIGHTSFTSLEVYNTTGQSLLQLSETTEYLDLSEYAAGIYYVIVKGKDYQSIEKIIKL